MKKFVPTTLVAFMISAFSQLGFLMNSSVIGGRYLTIIGVSLGVICGAIFFIVRYRVYLNNLHIIHNVDRQPWYQSRPMYLQTFFFSMFTGLLFVSLLNNLPQGIEKIEDGYVVKSLKERRVRYDYFEYLVLEGNERQITYMPKSTESFEKGQKVSLVLKRGFLGFAVVSRVVVHDI